MVCGRVRAPARRALTARVVDVEKTAAHRAISAAREVRGVVSAFPHGYSRLSAPPAAASSHSASMGSVPPSQMQNANASYQLAQVMGRPSFVPGTSVHVGGSLVPSLHARSRRNDAWSAGKNAFQLASHPLFGTRGCAPAPAGGADDARLMYAPTKARKRPTVTSYLSSANAATAIGCSGRSWLSHV